MLTAEALSHVYRCGSPDCSLAPSSALMGEQGEFYFLFFQITGTGWHTPPAVTVPEAINHLKMDMVESFPPYEGEDYKNKGQMESERGIKGGGEDCFPLCHRGVWVQINPSTRAAVAAAAAAATIISLHQMMKSTAIIYVALLTFTHSNKIRNDV